MVTRGLGWIHCNRLLLKLGTPVCSAVPPRFCNLLVNVFYTSWYWPPFFETFVFCKEIKSSLHGIETFILHLFLGFYYLAHSDKEIGSVFKVACEESGW